MASRYNDDMPLPASLIASIISAVIETASQGSGATATEQQYEVYKVNRTLPPEAKTGLMQPPKGDGSLLVGGKTWTLSPTAQFRNEANLIVMPMTIKEAKDVVFITDSFNAVHRVWIISKAEVSALEKK